MAEESIPHWSPSAPAERPILDAVLRVCGLLSMLLLVETVAWGTVVAGFVAAALAVGPIADSSIGTRVGAWFRRIGKSGRTFVIVAFAVIVFTAYPLLNVPTPESTSFILGGMGGLLAVEALERVRSRRRVTAADGSR